jgi:hypothetical protein
VVQEEAVDGTVVAPGTAVDAPTPRAGMMEGPVPQAAVPEHAKRTTAHTARRRTIRVWRTWRPLACRGVDARVGFFSFSEVTDRAAHRAYNEWHQLDHLPEQYRIRGVLHGQRWVATPKCLAARARAEPWIRPAQYMTVYLMGEPLAPTLEEFAALAGTLHREGRFFGPRKSYLSGPFGLVARSSAPRVLVSPETVALRPHLGVYAVVEEEASALAPVSHPDLVAVPGVAGAWTFVADPTDRHERWDPGDRRVTVCYLDSPPLGVARSLNALVLAESSPFPGHVSFAGPFEVITPWRWDWFD